MDVAWYEQAYKDHHRAVYLYAAAMLREREIKSVTADDMVQEAFFQLFLSMDRVKGHPEKMPGWLILVVKNKLDNISQKRTLKTISLDAMTEFGSAVEYTVALRRLTRELEQQEIRSEVLARMAKIVGSEDMELLIRKYGQKMSIAELAKQHRMTEGAMKMRLKRARNKARHSVRNMLILAICVTFLRFIK